MPEIVRARSTSGARAPRRERLRPAPRAPLRARGLASPRSSSTTLQSLVAPERLHHVDDAARLLADAIARGERC
jgi:hypothetical protein